MTMRDAGVNAVLITERLSRRHVRSSNRRAESRAFSALSTVGSRDPRLVPQKLVNVALDLCAAGSAGISVLRRRSKGDYLHWNAVAGQFSGHTNVVTPRDFSPCGTAIDGNAAQLFHCPGRFFTYLNGLGAPVVELLVVPIYADAQVLGTVWVASHDAWPQDRDAKTRQFDAADLRIAVGLAELAAPALQKLSSLQAADPSQGPFGPAALDASPAPRWPGLGVNAAVSRWSRRLASTVRSLSH